MDKPSVSRLRTWLQHLRPILRKVALFVLGIAAALVGLLIYSLVTPAPQPLSPNDVSTQVSQVLASATPPAPFSEKVYQIIRPSLVFIESTLPGKDGKP